MGLTHRCVLGAGGVKCWGLNYSGQIGDGNEGPTADVDMPFTPTDLAAGVTRVWAAGNVTCAAVGGAIKCMGNNLSGQLGSATGQNVLTPTAVPQLAGALELAGGEAFVCARFSGHVQCAGRDLYQELGVPPGTNVATGTFVKTVF